MVKAWVKQALASASDTVGLPTAFYSLNRRLRGCYLRSINYHETEPEYADSLRRQLAYFAEHFCILDEAQLRGFFAGRLALDKPALVLCFDDGQVNNHEVAADILDELGMCGWFFVIAGFAGTSKTWPGGVVRHYMDWDRVADLAARGHVVGCHTYSHPRLSELSYDELVHETVEAKHEIEKHIGAPVTSFCYPFGTIAAYDAQALSLLSREYEFLFTSIPSFMSPDSSPYNIGRVPLEPHMTLDMVAFLSHGLVDLMHPRRRLHYRRLLQQSARNA